MDSGRQVGLGRRMAHLVAHVNKIRFPGPDFFRHLDGRLDGQMRGVKTPAQGIQNEDFRPSGRFHGRLRHFVAIGVVGQQFASMPPEDIARAGHASMGQRHRDDVRVAQIEWSFDDHGFGAHVGFEDMLGVENVMKNRAQGRHGRGRGVDRHPPVLHFAKTAQIIESQHVIAVGMRVEHGIEAAQTQPQTLRAEVRGRIDGETHLLGFHVGRRAQARIPGIGRQAHGTIAANHRNPCRGSGAKKSDCQLCHCFDSGAENVILPPMSATLASLRIKNFALVEDLTWSPGAGFNAASGETGAGKSILIGALKLLLGDRADRTLIRAGAEQCTVEALFETADPALLDDLLEKAGTEKCEDGQLILRRVLTAAGGRQFVNGSPCNLALLRELGDLLVDLHGPHDHQSLFSREEQTRLLDDFAGLTAEAEGFREARRQWLALVREEQEINESAREVARERELLAHQTHEIEEAELLPEEEETLLARHRAAGNAQRLQEVGSAALALLGEAEPSLPALSGELGRLFRELSRLDESAKPLETRHLEVHESLLDLSRDLDRYLGRLEVDPARLAEMETRLDLIGSLRRKYGQTIPEILAFAAEARERLQRLTDREERGGHLAEEIRRARAEVERRAKKLSQGRKKAAEQLAKAVAGQLLELGFRQAGFNILLEPHGADEGPGPQGAELADFLFAPNPGEPARPLRQIASSGEISRVMLALKCALAAQDRVALLVFDEIDANVGGETATKVGAKMAELGRWRQVLCITHLPQVAASATTQFLVSKEVREGRTLSQLQLLEGDRREEEIARMLGGATESARTHARELLRQNLAK